MTEILNIIVLACKLGTSNVNLAHVVYEKESKCQKAYIACMDSKGSTLLSWSPANLRDCLKELR